MHTTEADAVVVTYVEGISIRQTIHKSQIPFTRLFICYEYIIIFQYSFLSLLCFNISFAFLSSIETKKEIEYEFHVCYAFDFPS